jgi:hypothetical protein
VHGNDGLNRKVHVTASATKTPSNICYGAHFQTDIKRKDFGNMTHFNAYVLVPGDTKDVEATVSDLMASYDANLESIPYPRECECVYDSALKKLERGQHAMNGKVQGPVIEFKKDAFEKAGPELIQKLEFLRLGSPYAACGNCSGSGISTTSHNYATEWDGWEIVPNVTAGALKGCIEGNAYIRSDQSHVPVKVLNLDKVPPPRSVVTPDGVWHSYRKYIWFSNAAITDENWEHTFKNLLAAHPDAALVVVDYHI